MLTTKYRDFLEILKNLDFIDERRSLPNNHDDELFEDKTIDKDSNGDYVVQTYYLQS